LAVAEETLNLATRGVEVYKFMTMQLRIRRAQNDETRRGRVCLLEEDHKAQATLQRLVPHHGGRQVQMRRIFPCAEGLETAQGLQVDLPVILALCPTSLWVRTGGEKHAVGIAPQLGDGVQIEANDCSNILLLCLVAIHAMIRDARRQAMPMRPQLLLVTVYSCLFLRSLRGILARRRLRDGQRESAPAGDIHHSERGHLQPACGTTRTAVKEGPETARLRAPLREEGRVRRRDQCRARVERRPQHALMKVWPVKRLPKLSCDGAFRVVAGATQVAEGDATTSHKDRDEHRGKELPLGLSEPGHVFQDVVEHCHKPFTGSRGSGIR